MRFHNIGISIRQVLHEHLLVDKYLLRAGATIFMPSTVQHFSPAIWGANASQFKYNRFADCTRPHVPSVPYRAFGGGATLCPRRHFATTDILALAAMLVLRFDVKSVGGEWVMPSTRKAGMTSVMPAPDYDVQVKIGEGEADAGVRWEWVVAGSTKLGVDEV
jgi:cytochrome P450